MESTKTIERNHRPDATKIRRELAKGFQFSGQKLKVRDWPLAMKKTFAKNGPLTVKVFGCSLLAQGIQQTDRNLYHKLEDNTEWKTEEVLTALRESIRAGGSPLLDLILPEGFAIIPVEAERVSLDEGVADAVTELSEGRRFAKLHKMKEAVIHWFNAERVTASLMQSQVVS